MSIINITSVQQLEEFLQTTGNLVIKFSTTTCSPCKSYNPIFKKYSQEVEDVLVAESILDTSDSDLLDYVKDKLSLTSVPTTIAIKDKQILKTLGGALSLNTLNSLFL